MGEDTLVAPVNETCGCFQQTCGCFQLIINLLTAISLPKQQFQVFNNELSSSALAEQPLLFTDDGNKLSVTFHDMSNIAPYSQQEANSRTFVHVADAFSQGDNVNAYNKPAEFSQSPTSPSHNKYPSLYRKKVTNDGSSNPAGSQQYVERKKADTMPKRGMFQFSEDIPVV